MGAKLQLQSSQLAFEDNGAGNNTPTSYVNLTRSINEDVANPASNLYTIQPGATLTCFNASVSTSIGSGTEFVLSRTPLGNYRFTWDSTGTNPAFRTDRGLNLATVSVLCVLNNNQTLTMSANTGSFAGVVAGDTLFLSGPTTGDAASPFSTFNQGYWQVLGIDGTNTTLQLGRTSGSFLGKSETVTVTSASQLQAFSASGIQVGYSVRISAGFTNPVLGTYTVTAINPIWFEVTSTLPLPISATAIPGISGISFYSSAKRWIRVEADQLSSVRINGDTSDFNQITPWTPGDNSLVGAYESTNVIYSLLIVNKSAATLNLTVISVE